MAHASQRPPSRTGHGSLDSRFERSRVAVFNRRLSDLSSEQLDRVLGRLESESAGLADEMVAIEGQTQVALAANDWRGVQDLREKALDVASGFDELKDLRAEAQNGRNERFLRERMSAALGGDGRALTYDLVMMLLITLVVGLVLVQQFMPVDKDTGRVLDYVDIGACVIFLVDFFWRAALSDQRKWFFKRYWLDFVTSIPVPANVVRMGRLVRLVRLLRMLRVVRVLRVFRSVFFFWRGMDKLVAALDMKLMRRSLNILIATLLVGAGGIYALEGGPNKVGVESFGQSLWWSFTTAVTGGFPDLRNPDTIGGRLLTVALIVAGMVVVGIFTATLTSILVREGDSMAALQGVEERLHDKLEQLQLQAAEDAKSTEDEDLG